MKEQATNQDIRCGTDMVAISRINRAITRSGQAFLDRIYAPSEQTDCLPDGRMTAAGAASLAARFAAKEAVSKALGTGIGRCGVIWTDIVVRRLPDGAPVIALNGAAHLVFEQLGGQSIAISLTHEKSHALAFCVMTCSLPDNRDVKHE